MTFVPIDPLWFDRTGRDEQMTTQDSLRRRCGDRTSHEEQMNNIVNRIEDCMNHEDLESVYEGLSILLHVTNANHSGYRIAEDMSKILLTSTTATMTSKMTLSLGLRARWYTEDELSKHDIRCDATIMKDYSLLALRIIGQAVNLLDHESMNMFVSNATSILSNGEYPTIVSTLYQYIRSAEEQPHLAYCATHILGRICEMVPDICTIIVQDDPEYIPIIQKAVTFGKIHHVSLERASQRLLSYILYE
jgi:hypothetical protein